LQSLIAPTFDDRSAQDRSIKDIAFIIDPFSIQAKLLLHEFPDEN
jgi:hypothetical protein